MNKMKRGPPRFREYHLKLSVVSRPDRVRGFSRGCREQHNGGRVRKESSGLYQPQSNYKILRDGGPRNKEGDTFSHPREIGL